MVDQLYDAKQLGTDNTAELLQFGMRPGVEIRNLCWGDIGVGCDPDGTAYSYINRNGTLKPKLAMARILEMSGKENHAPMKQGQRKWIGAYVTFLVMHLISIDIIRRINNSPDRWVPLFPDEC